MKLVIFDLDDTLVNFAATRQVAYGEMARLLDREGVDSAAFIRACVQVDKPLFTQFEQGLMTRQDYRMRRFADPFELIGVAPVGDIVLRLNKLFMDCVNDSPLLYDDVRPVLAGLRAQGFRTAILTNGPADGQRRKLKATGLEAEVDHVAIGEEAGVSKPLPAAYLRVVRHFDVPAAEVLMVGDSPELDHDGAVSAGLQALLLDRDARHAGGARPTIVSLDELADHL